MKLPIGEMREVVAILTPTTITDEAGGQETTYSQSQPLFVALRPASARESKEFDQINASVSHIVFGHWHDLNALFSSARLKHLETSHEFDIVGPPLNDGKKQFTRLNVLRRENG